MELISQVVRIVSSFLAWLLFAYWWRKVTRPSWTPPSEITLSILLVILVVLVFILFAMLWIKHNMKLASRGKRGKVSNYNFAVFTQDVLKRPIMLDPLQSKSAKLLVLDLEEGKKVYRAQVAARGSAGAS